MKYAYLEVLKNTPKGFEDFVKDYFEREKPRLEKLLKKWKRILDAWDAVTATRSEPRLKLQDKLKIEWGDCWSVATVTGFHEDVQIRIRSQANSDAEIYSLQYDDEKKEDGDLVLDFATKTFMEEKVTKGGDGAYGKFKLCCEDIPKKKERYEAVRTLYRYA